MPVSEDGLDQAAEQDDRSSDATLRLVLLPGVGPRTRQALLRHFGSADAVLDAPRAELCRVPGVGGTLSGRIVAAQREVDVADLRNICRRNAIRILVEADPDYPRRLLEIPDPPGVLFLKGRLQPADDLAVAIVGTRHATRYGRRQAGRLAAGLVRAGYTVVSGLARGVDAAAHEGALQAGGRTLAILGGGLLNLYPPEHGELARRIAEQGCVISESPPYQPPQSGAFPQRNRLISGLSLGVVVVEAAERSGALITATHAAEQGRDVFAVPGRVDSRASRGCHQLLRDGARLVESIDDVLDELGPLADSAKSDDPQTIRHPAELQLNDQEQAVLRAIETDSTDIDLVIRRSGLPTQRVLATLSVLEMRHLVSRVRGNRVVRK
jgi:DNA processing protein